MRKIITCLCILAFAFMSTGILPAQQNEQDEKFQEIIDEYLEALWKFYPSQATLQGYHAFDDKLEDMGSRNIEKHQEELDEFNQEFVAEVDQTQLSPEYQAIHTMIVNGLELEIMKHENLLPWEYDPIFYNHIIYQSVRSLMTGDFGNPEDRAKNAVKRLNNLPKLIKQAMENLKTPAKIYTETAIEQMPIIMDFYENELPGLIAQDPSREQGNLQKKLDDVLPELRKYQTFLTDDLLIKSTGNFRLGAAHRRLMRTTLQSHLTLEQLVAQAKADQSNITREMFLVCIPFYRIMYPDINLERLTTQRGEDQVRSIVINGVLEKIRADQPDPSDWLSSFQQSKEAVQEFFNENQMIPLPEAELEVREMASIHTGPCLTKLMAPPLYGETSGYQVQIAPLDKWTEEQTVSLLNEYNTLYIPFYTVRNIFPGPFVPTAMTFNDAPVIQKLYANQPLLMGWPVLLEEAMVTSGFGNFDLRLRLNQLKIQLKNVINFNLELNIHEGGMTKEQALAYATRSGFMTEAEAERTWNEIILNPGKAAYTYVGYQDLLQMEETYKKEKGDTYDRKEFLTEVLSHGPIPLRLLRDKI
jgi:hypothetical protein